MPRCKHNRVRIIERTGADLGFEFTGGVLTDNWASDSHPEGLVVVQCDECGYSRNFRDARRMPAWAKSLWDSIRP